MFCEQCGTKIDKNERLCQKCSGIKSINLNIQNNKKLLISAIIGCITIVISIIYIFIFFNNVGFNINQTLLTIIRNISIMVGIIAIIFNFIGLIKYKKLYLLIAGITYSVSIIFSIYYIIGDISNEYFSFNINFILWNLPIFLVIPGIFCILEFIKMKKNKI